MNELATAMGEKERERDRESGTSFIFMRSARLDLRAPNQPRRRDLSNSSRQLLQLMMMMMMTYSAGASWTPPPSRTNDFYEKREKLGCSDLSHTSHHQSCSIADLINNPGCVWTLAVSV